MQVVTPLPHVLNCNVRIKVMQVVIPLPHVTCDLISKVA